MIGVGHRLCLQNYEIDRVNELSHPDQDIINFPFWNFNRTVSQLDGDSSWTKIAQPRVVDKLRMEAS